MNKTSIRIANAGGYWGDDPYALRRQLEGSLALDFISIDYLAEVTMSILQKQKARDPKLGYARDFVSQLKPLVKDVVNKKICIITNAGGVNPNGCAEALIEMAAAQGVTLKVAVVDGDNIADRLEDLIKSGVSFKNMETGEALAPYADRVLSANAYFGAMPVVEALKCKPDVVLCGRVTDTGITLAAMMHSFSWAADDYDKLAHGIVAGHIIECGAQATGGNFTDWRKVPSFIDVGFPIVECFADGHFFVTKHPGSGGLVTTQTVREQLLYEMGHPQSYIVPDVIADFTTIQLENAGADRVKVSGVKGRAPTDLLKISIAYADGFKSNGALIISGPDARAKAEVFADVFWKRLDAELTKASMTSFEQKHTEYIGSDSTQGGLTPQHVATEILLRLSVHDHSEDKFTVFRKLLPSMILSGPSGVAVTGGAPAVSDVVSYWPALIDQHHALPNVSLLTRDAVQNKITHQQLATRMPWPVTKGSSDVSSVPRDPFEYRASGKKKNLSLMHIAHARSGDKGDTSNIGLIGRSAECYAWLRDNVSESLVKNWFHGICLGHVHRYAVPNLWALNFLLEETLGGGGTMSLHIDAQGKTLSQALLRCEMEIPEGLLATIAPEDAATAGELVHK